MTATSLMGELMGTMLKGEVVVDQTEEKTDG